MPVTHLQPEACDPGDDPEIDVKSITVQSAVVQLVYKDSTGSFNLDDHLGVLEDHLMHAYLEGEPISTVIDEAIIEEWVEDYGTDEHYFD